jgi:hypothetical protein
VSEADLPAPVLSILDAVDPVGLRELERVLRAKLAPPATAAERRVTELGCLAKLLVSAGAEHWLGFREIEKQTYDSLRPEGAPSGALLAKRHHSWLEACRAADGLLPDGRYRGSGRPWPQRRGVTPTVITEQDCVKAISACALGLGRPPSSHDYALWCRATREAARRTGTETVPPTLKTIYRFWPASDGGWTAARQASDTYLGRLAS